MRDSSIQSDAGKEAWESVLASLCHLQEVLPEAVLVGGTAAALYARHRFSFDHDHVIPDLRQRFDTVLMELEAIAGRETARIKRPVVIPGSLDGVETGVRQLHRTRPLETTVMQVGDVGVTLPTLPEVLRIKAFLCLDRNATRDYLDLAALASAIGSNNAVEALWRMDELYPQKNDDPWAVRTQMVMQFAAPPPYDLDIVDLAEYKGVRPPFDRWSHIVDVCGTLSDELLNTCVQAFEAESSLAAQAARSKLDSWRDARAGVQAPALSRLPGLKS